MDQLDSIEGSMVVSSDLDGLINFLEEERNTESKTNLILVAAYLSNENINEAFDEMNTYESQVDTLDNREQIFSLIVETIVDGYKLNEIDSTKESFLRSLEDSYSDRSFGMARSLLSMNWGDFYHPYQEEDYPARMAAPASEEIPETNQPSNNYLASSLVVVPNPFNNEVSIETDVQECGGQTTLQIRSITGQLMLSKKLTSGKNTVRIYTDNMESGAYICYILCDNEIINNVKVFKY